MTRDDIADVFRILASCFTDAALRLEQAEPGVDSHPEPDPSQMASNARKRGRPKKDSQARPKKQPTPEPSGDELVKCDLCNREIPADALSIHHINCAAAQAGYWENK